MWGGPSSGPAKPAETEPPASDAAPNPFGPWAAMMSGMLGAGATPEPPQARPARAKPPEAESQPESTPPQNPFEFFSHMVETGLEAQQQYVAALQNIFDIYWGAGPQRR
jgi:hypothetical protein